MPWHEETIVYLNLIPNPIIVIFDSSLSPKVHNPNVPELKSFSTQTLDGSLSPRRHNPSIYHEETNLCPNPTP